MENEIQEEANQSGKKYYGADRWDYSGEYSGFIDDYVFAYTEGRNAANYEIEHLTNIIERGNEIRNNWENGEYQEAAHYNWLDDQINRLEAENKALKECVEFYANINHWSFIEDYDVTFPVIDNDSELYKNSSGEVFQLGGVKARKTLKKLTLTSK